MKRDRQPMAFSCVSCSTESDTSRDCWECKAAMTPTPRRAPRHEHDREEDAA